MLMSQHKPHADESAFFFLFCVMGHRKQLTSPLVVCADVYERLTPKDRKPPFYVVLITQTVSGVWHGLFPGYGLFFVSSAFAIEASKVVYRYERAYAPKLSKSRSPAAALWGVVKWVFTAFVLNYAASAFMVWCTSKLSSPFSLVLLVAMKITSL